LSGRNVPIIALTAGALKEEKKSCIASGMNDFLTKPLVSEKIKEMLNKYLTKNEHSTELILNDKSENDLHMAYDEFVSLFDNLSIIKEVIGLALRDIPAQIIELENASKEKNQEKLHDAAHRLWGSSSNMRFSLMAEIVKKIESKSNDNWNSDLALELSELNAEWEIVKKIIERKIN
jgi:HPt (histidine-containing phosphotransfer) domain-containing protein